MPQCVLCSCRGLASFPSRPMGEFSLRRWDSVEAKVRRLSTWETPALVWWAFRWSPQFPVAREYFSPSVMVFVLIASSRLKSWEKRREERGLANTVGKVKLALSPGLLPLTKKETRHKGRVRVYGIMTYWTVNKQNIRPNSQAQNKL